MKRLLWLASLGAVATAAVALAQRAPVGRPLTLVVGGPEGRDAVVRGGPRRDGHTAAALPHGPLHVDWKIAVGGPVEQPPIVTHDAIILATARGEVIWLPPDPHDGRETARQSLGIAATTATAPTLLSDGTVVMIGGAVDAVVVGIDKTGVRFRTPLNGVISGATALDIVTPLALDDGGFAVATHTEIALLDAAGNFRARAALSEAGVGPLLASGGRIFLTGKSGVVYAWSPGTSGGGDVSRVGSFPVGQGADELGGGAVFTGPDTLMAVVHDSRLMTLDLKQAVAVPLASFAGGGFLGPIAYHATPTGGVAYLLAGVPGHTFLVGIDASGQEVQRTPVGSSSLAITDGGVPVFLVPPHVPVLVDDTGTVAFAAPEGPVGVVDPAGVPSSIDVCPHGFGRQLNRIVTSLVPAGPGAFLVTCASGQLLRITHE